MKASKAGKDFSVTPVPSVVKGLAPARAESQAQSANAPSTAGQAWSEIVNSTNFPLPEVTTLVTMQPSSDCSPRRPIMNIGETIRNFRLERGMSQGDIEKRTGLLRCYLSRVENGHTIPSLDTLAKIAGAMELPLSQFFAESGQTNGSKGLPQLSDDEVRFLSQIRRYAVSLNDSDRKLVLAMVKKMAASIGK